MSKKTHHVALWPLHWQSRGFFVILLIWGISFLVILFYVLLLGSFFKSNSHELKVVSYNIWNYHSYWNTRKKGIAEVIRNAYPDIVLLQEVRSAKHNAQLEDLMNLLPFMKYSAFAVATPHADYDSAEGLGILSRYPIKTVDHYNFTQVPTDGDTNTRTCLSATIDVPNIGLVQFYVTHLSYERTTQCRQIAELLTYIEKDNMDGDCAKKIPKIAAGDFNIYANFEAPSDVMTQPVSQSNPCYPYLGESFQTSERNEASFIDVWRELHPDDPGLTFSLMPFKDAEHLVPSTGLESRPDRIYLKKDSCVLRATSIHKTRGDEYQRHFYRQILFEQMSAHFKDTGWGTYIYISPFFIYGFRTISCTSRLSSFLLLPAPFLCFFKCKIFHLILMTFTFLIT